MKKFFFLFAAILMAANLIAQEQTPILECHGNTYFYGREAMTQRQMLDWYAQHNCQAAYLQFEQGQKMANAGWACLGVSAACHVGLWACLGIAMYGEADFEKLMWASYGLAAGHAAFGAACIPLLIVGHHKMHGSVDRYNVSCSMAKAQPYWSVQASNNGLGLALNF